MVTRRSLLQRGATAIVAVCLAPFKLLEPKQPLDRLHRAERIIRCLRLDDYSKFRILLRDVNGKLAYGRQITVLEKDNTSHDMVLILFLEFPVKTSATYTHMGLVDDEGYQIGEQKFVGCIPAMRGDNMKLTYTVRFSL